MVNNKVYESKLKELRTKEAEDLARIFAGKYSLPYADLSRMSINVDALKIIPEKKAKKGQMAVFQKVGKKLQIAVRNPELTATKNLIKELENEKYSVDLFLVSEASLERAWARYKEVPVFKEMRAGVVSVSTDSLEKLQKETNSLDSIKKLVAPALSGNEIGAVSEILEVILAGALALKASDIHIEPSEGNTKLRYRLDGVLHDLLEFKTSIYKLLVSRIKLLAEMKLNVRKEPQDGRFTIRSFEQDIEVRVSALPGEFGESLVLRILNPETIALTLENLGMQPETLKTIENELKKPNGMILTTGPTGSGKTTTLYSFIKKINSPDIKVITIEDPIEYHIKGITQSNVSKNYTFSSGLRSIVRQDPDVILVGEIRDFETADIAMHASLTGHLVFSTLHTNDAVGTIPRLLDLKVKPELIAPALNASVAQRLVRILCKDCKKEVNPDKGEEKIIQNALKEIPEEYKKGASSEMKIFKPEGCDECAGIGYKGRMGVFEIILIDEGVENIITKNVSESDLKREMKRQNMITMFQDGILKVLDGATSLEEVIRVVGQEN